MKPLDELDQLILSRYPYPLAINYKRLLDEHDPERRTRAAIRVFQFGLRAVALQIISQYLQQDVDDIPDATANMLLCAKINRATDGVWKRLLFSTLEAYAGHRERLACPELADLLGHRGTGRQPKDVHGPIDGLIEARNRLEHGLPPGTEEEWRELSEQVIDKLRTVLGFFSFLENYDLVLCRQGDAGRECVFFTGLEPRVVCGDLPANIPPDDYEFYLRSRNGERLVPMHPLVIYWQLSSKETESAATGIPDSDAALYNSFSRSTVRYLATVLWKEVAIRAGDETFQEFFARIGSVLKRIAGVRRSVPALTWEDLGLVASSINDDQMGDAAGRYDAGLYLQREPVRLAFKDFLSSMEKKAFVLLGSSGVGKSCFVLSLLEEYQSLDACRFLLYNSALLEGGEPIQKALSRPFGVYLEITTAAGTRQIDDVLAEINCIDGIMGRQVVLIFDSVNENDAPEKLLRQVRTLVEGVTYPWLKVVLTCRPEAWRRLSARSGLGLAAARYYRRCDAALHGIELGHSDAVHTQLEDWVHLEPFALDEVPSAYARYQEVFGLQPDYASLEPSVQETIRDPLALRLVADTWHNGTIPPRLRASELRKKYIDHLLATGRLHPGDLDLLTHVLMPLMIGPGRFANILTAEQIQAEMLPSGERLFDLVLNEEVLEGKAINQGFVNLVNADILALRGSSTTDYELGFQYERFYEYFAGRRLFELVHAQASELAGQRSAYLDLGVQTDARPFLWGALRDALFLEMEKRPQEAVRDLFPALAEQQSSGLRSALLAALVEFARASPASVAELVSALLSRVGEARQEGGMQACTGGSLAAELAFRLRDWDSLERAALMRSGIMRSLGVTYLFYLWPSDPERAEKVLRTIVDRVRAGPLGFDGGAFEALIGYSVPVLFEHRGEPHTVRAVQKAWQEVLSHFPFNLLLRGGGAMGVISRVVLPAVVAVLARVVGAYHSVAPRGESVNALAELNAFYSRNERTHERLERLIPYLEPAHGDLRAEEGTILELVVERDGIAELITWLVLLAHSLRNPEEMLPLLQKGFDAAVSQSPPTPYTQAFIATLQNILYDQDPVDPQWLARTEAWMRRVMETSRFHMRTKTGMLRKSYMDWYLHNYYRCHNSVDSALAVDYVNGARDGTDPRAMEDFLVCMETLGVELQNPPAAIAALATYCDWESATREPGLVPLLAELRFHDAETVDYFLERSSTPASFRDQVRSHPPKESEKPLGRLGAWAIRDTILVQPNPWLVQHLQALLFDLVRSKNTNQALRSILTALARIVYGEAPRPIQ